MPRLPLVTPTVEPEKQENYKHILSGAKIGKMHLKNRMIMAPMGTFSENRNGSPSQTQIEYYRARARGGAAMILLEGQYITNKTDPWIDYVTTADTDQQMQGWSKIAEVVHAEGSKLCLQLSCGLGRNAFPFSDDQMVSASEVPSFYFPDRLCRALSKDEVKDIVESYGRAAARAVVAEADCVEIHAHAGYMIDQFMTEAWNKRTDEYGGNFENRMRLVTEIYHAIRNEVGPDYPILIRLAADHDFEGGRTIEETIEICKYLEELGIDAFDIDMGCYEDKQWIVPSIYSGEACMAPYGAMIKEHLKVPVLNAGNLSPDSAEKALAEGLCDFVMFGRQLIADPDTPNKIRENRLDDIRPCLFCNQICVGRLYENRPIGCAINAQAVSELDYQLKVTDNPKKVVVIGGGPGGMEAARVAGLQGHKVTLYEKSSKLGGQLIPASTPIFKNRLKQFMEWQIRQLDKANVKVVLNHEIQLDSPELKEADEIVVAVGASPIRPNLNGVELDKVIEVCDAHINPEKIKGNKIVVAGGGLSGCDIALELALEGKEVTIVEMQDELCPEELLDNRNPLLFRLEDLNVMSYTGHEVVEFNEDGVVIKDKDGKQFSLEADSIIYSFGMKRNTLIDEILDKYPAAYPVGDCDEVSQISKAVREGFFAGWSIH